MKQKRNIIFPLDIDFEKHAVSTMTTSSEYSLGQPYKQLDISLRPHRGVNQAAEPPPTS